MNRDTGSSISLIDHIRQSVADILTTRVGTRTMRRDYGSQLPDLIDQPFNTTTKLRAYAAIVAALIRWEPRIRISQVQLSSVTMTGQVELTLECTLVDDNEPLNLQVPLSMGASV
ncbi:baseplate assembly protein [Pseudomonas citronellolis]|uniref:GPW/gp25 family protein n=1 Tax=Pseudomonas citronellolis TaxID=53408 RepID=UPI0022BA70DA|nr:GPW/gp25 family protein [Pseudomonas citronellolis]WBG63411.1 baseplate assembly protein [Pseudomonas citronellolis]